MDLCGEFKATLDYRENPRTDRESSWVMVVHAFNPSTRAVGYISCRPAWSTDLVPGQPRLHKETLSRKKQQQLLQQNSEERK